MITLSEILQSILLESANYALTQQDKELMLKYLNRFNFGPGRQETVKDAVVSIVPGITLGRIADNDRQNLYTLAYSMLVHGGILPEDAKAVKDLWQNLYAARTKSQHYNSAI